MTTHITRLIEYAVDADRASTQKNTKAIREDLTIEDCLKETCQHPNTINTLDSEICEDCGKENND